MIGFGLTAVGGSTTLVSTGGEGRLVRGRTEASSPDPTSWRGAAFDDGGWEAVRFPLFHALALSGTDLTDMPGQYTSVFVRRSFQIDSPEQVVRFELGAICDGGYIAWINGQEVRRVNVPEGDPGFAATALAELPEPVRFETVELEAWSGLLTAGTNVLAVQAFSSSRTDDPDFVLDCSLVGVLDDEPPVVEAVVPSPGSTLRELGFIEVQFNEPVRGVDAADLLVNGAAATNVVEVAAGDFLFSVEAPPDGVVQVSWRPDHGITDRVGALHPFAGEGWAYVMDTTGPVSGLRITEFMADNRRTLNDEDGDSSDWIEVFNGGAETVSLEGWCLTDTRALPAQWRFPAVEIPAQGYLVVFASGKDRAVVGAKLHTNFKLTTDGGYLALVDPAGGIVSEFGPAYPRQLTDVSYGQAPGEIHAVGYFTKATPGALNLSSGPGFAPEVVFSRPGGIITNTVQLALSSSLAGAVIRYTVDGNLPTNSSPVYQGPIAVTNSMQVRARAYADGLLPGPPRSEAFLMLGTNMLGFSSDLPVLVLHSLGKGAPNSSRLNFAQLDVLEPHNGVTTLTNVPTLRLRAGVQVRGSSTEGLPKASYKLELWDEFGVDKDYALLGLPADSDWVLYAPNQFDPVLIHNPFIHQLSRDMGRYSSRTRFVEVYFNRGTGPITSAHYSGIYVLEEKIKIGADRVAIDELEAENLTPPSVTGGYLLKIDRLDPGDSGLGAAGATLGFVDPKEREVRLTQRRPQQDYVRSYFNAFAKALTATNWLDPNLGYRAYFDVDAAIDFHVLEVVSGNVDALVLSTYLHKPRNGKITFGPHWDFDRALGSTDGRDANPRTWSTGPFFSAAWWNRMFVDKNFWQQWVDRYQEMRQDHLSLTNVHRLIDQLANEVRRAQPREYTKWRIAMRGGSYQSEINLMKNWVSNRLDFIDRQLAQPPRLSRAGGPIPAGFALTITPPAGATVYYTLDGTDPRSPTGAVSAKAVVYSGPVTLDGNARVVARSHDASKRQTGGPPVASYTPWSRPMAATYVVSTPRLLITEIMFHPEPPPLGSGDLASDLEYIELANLGTTALELPGFRLTNGVDFVFAPTSAVTRLAPGERVLVVSNREAFARRYPNALPIAGEFTGSLSDGGQRVTLIGPLQEPISDLSYEDAWARLADGFGFSLVLADENSHPADLGQAGRWRQSARAGGSPGAVDPAPPALPVVWVSEISSATVPPEVDAVELANPAPEPADISGWYLTDDFRVPRKYRFPAGTTVPARGLLVVTERQFNAPGGTGFALSSSGEEVHLFSADGQGELTGYAHGFAFGAAEPGMSYGLYAPGGGEQVFVAQAEPTLGAPNSGARVGPVVISEIQYAPPEAAPGIPGEEYIELRNLSSRSVPLYDPGRPAITWRLRGGVDLDFPPGVTLPPSGLLVLVGFSPAQDLGRLLTFRQQYHASEDVMLLGPWAGQLDNSGEAVRLLRPARAGVAGGATGSYIVIEQVEYAPGAPWPAAAHGGGYALGRYFETAYAGAPGNWRAVVPSPGRGDADGDGLPDDWELQNGLSAFDGEGVNGPLGDPDKNGVNNRESYLVGRRAWAGPTTVVCRVLAGGAPAVVLGFNARVGYQYQIESCEAHAGAVWELEQTVAPVMSSGNVEVTLPRPEGPRWYRVRLE